MMSRVVLLACAMHAIASSLVWFKANSKRLYDIDLHPIVWWLLTGWLLETLYLNAWWKLSESSSPWIAQITLASVGTLVSLIWMSVFYGFSVKYLISAVFICAGFIVSKV